MKRTRIVAVGSLLLVGVLSPVPAVGAPAPAPAYTVVDLGVLPGGTYSEASSLTEGSPPAVAGYAQDASRGGRAFLWEQATGMRDLGPADPLFFGVDANRRVVGTSASTLGAFQWTELGDRQAVGHLGGTGGASANAVHATGGVVGSGSTPGGEQHAFRQVGSVVSDLGTLGGAGSEAYGVNAAGTVVGSSATAGGEGHAFVWTPTTGMSDIGTLGACCRNSAQSMATAVNDAGVVTGWTSSTAAQATHAFVWDASGGLRDLGALPARRGGSVASEAWDVNNSGDVVGASKNRAVLFQGGQVVDLNTRIGKVTRWVLERAFGVNDAGYIVGHGTISGQRHGFLLVPTAAR